MEHRVDLAYSSTGVVNRRASYGVLGAVLAAHVGVLFVLATHRQPLPPVVEQALFVSLIAPEAQPEPLAKPKSQPVKPSLKPIKKTAMPQQAVAHREPEPQLALPTATETPVPTTEPKAAAPAAEALPVPQAAVTKVVEAALPKDEPVEQPRFNADYLDNPAPAYPPLSRKLREEGRVLLRVRVDPGGQPEQVALHESSGFPRLDERAADTVRRWKFVPARQGGQPVAAWVIVPIQFSLKG